MLVVLPGEPGKPGGPGLPENPRSPLAPGSPGNPLLPFGPTAASMPGLVMTCIVSHLCEKRLQLLRQEKSRKDKEM